MKEKSLRENLRSIWRRGSMTLLWNQGANPILAVAISFGRFSKSKLKKKKKKEAKLGFHFLFKGVLSDKVIKSELFIELCFRNEHIFFNSLVWCFNLLHVNGYINIVICHQVLTYKYSERVEIFVRQVFTRARTRRAAETCVWRLDWTHRLDLVRPSAQ